jgi:hypothetical protein
MIKTLLKIVISFNNVILNVAEWEFTVQIITIQAIVWAYFVIWKVNTKRTDSGEQD